MGACVFFYYIPYTQYWLKFIYRTKTYTTYNHIKDSPHFKAEFACLLLKFIQR